MDRKQNIKKKAHSSSAKKRRRARRKAAGSPILLGTLTAVLLILVGILVFSGAKPVDVPALSLTLGNNTNAVSRANVQTLPGGMDAAQPALPEVTVLFTEAPTPEPTATPEPTPEPVQATFEYLPVIKHGETGENKIAITVDDCFQVENLRTITKTAYAANQGKLTIFPIGQNLSLDGMKETLQTCVFQLGYEIENHTWSHARIFRLPEQEMAAEIWNQSQALNQLLGVNYEQHFLRLMGGDGNNDQRTHSFLSQLGFKGIADWSLSGSDADLDWIKKSLEPGMIYLFHTTDRDTGILQQFIPWAVKQGYELVTLNELMGFEENAMSEFQVSTMPQPQAYTVDYHTHKKGDYAWIIVQMQDKLRALGYLTMDGPSTGYFGDQTAAALKAFQQNNGLNPTGEADSYTQQVLLEG